MRWTTWRAIAISARPYHVGGAVAGRVAVALVVIGARRGRDAARRAALVNRPPLFVHAADRATDAETLNAAERATTDAETLLSICWTPREDALVPLHWCTGARRGGVASPISQYRVAAVPRRGVLPSASKSGA